jgi:hypothetical protein
VIIQEKDPNYGTVVSAAISHELPSPRPGMSGDPLFAATAECSLWNHSQFLDAMRDG